MLTEDNFADAYQALVGQYDLAVTTMPYPDLTSWPRQLARPPSPGASGTGNLYLNTNEDAELNTHMPTARDEHLASELTAESRRPCWPSSRPSRSTSTTGALAPTPRSWAATGWRRRPTRPPTSSGRWPRGSKTRGAMAARTAGYQRRADDWLLQANLAARELSQFGRQILASLLTEQAAGAEYTTAKAQVGQAQAVLDVHADQVHQRGALRLDARPALEPLLPVLPPGPRHRPQSGSHRQVGTDAARSSYAQPTSSPTTGTAATRASSPGEALYLDIKRLDLDYLTYNLRELELTRHVSLRQLDPVALLSLKITGSCTVTIPEWLYDRDCPGHYMRRIKSVAVSVPSVVGPYTSVNCTLSLQSSSVRVSPSLLSGGSYQRSTATTTPGSWTTPARSIRSSRAAPSRTTGCSRPTCATTASCPSKAPAPSAPGPCRCPPSRASTTRPSPT